MFPVSQLHPSRKPGKNISCGRLHRYLWNFVKKASIDLLSCIVMATKFSKEELEIQYEQDLEADEKSKEEIKEPEPKKKQPVLSLVEILKLLNSDSEEDALKGFFDVFKTKHYKDWQSSKEPYL